ncbi:protein dachsous-like isoform X5 [Vanessa tameamea]|uniref:Protein dachsous-like isoform X5 n=1 Tax=Vanessa tameamea TaxID=334116 RepID=A0ABM4AIK6_VANTA
MGDRSILFFYVIITTYLRVNHGCSIDGIPNWFVPVNQRILDTDSGIIYRRSTSGIEDLIGVTHRTEGLNGGPYVDVSLANSELTISTLDNFKTYEEIETALSIGFTAMFRCTDGSSRILVFNIDITDTNNNDPVFKPTNSYEITLAPPVPPNFLLTNCINDIIVRDIDLTTERIDFALEGSPLFEIAYDNSSTVPKEFKATLRTTTFIRSIPEAITFTVTATDVDRTGDSRRTATATVKVLADSQFELPDEPIFSQPFYIANYTKEHEFILQDSIYLRQGYDSGVKFSLDGQFSENFKLVATGNQITFTVTTLLPDEAFQQREIYLTVIAERDYTSGANAMIVLQLPGDTEAAFNKVLYNGKLEDGVVSHETITVSGYDGANIQIIGAQESSFEVDFLNGVVTIHKAPSAILPVGLTHIALTLQASRASAVLLLDITDTESETKATFSKVLYNGGVKNSVVSHETITISGYDGTSVQIIGDYESSFEADLSNGVVTIRKAASAVLPVGLTHIALTLQAGRANAVLLLDITNSEDTGPPTVTFSRTSYFLWADINQYGVVGRVQATAENGETISYSLHIDDDDNLRQLISINNEGEILLSAAVQSGVYSFIVTATAENSRVNATASVLLRVEALPECGTEIGLPPLIVLERTEEEPHKNLVALNRTLYKNCRYNLLNSWPADQSWLYVDEEGLHAKAIDREHESIAFMTLSQIQVELILQCDSDEVSVTKRSLNTERLQQGPDKYGSNKWILADTIVYDARRSFVNLIVTDINDNKPIFEGKENEPVYVGFPVPELEDTILPRALTQLKATDADIGENAALIYWSIEDNLAVAPQTGFVHVRNKARLENNSRLTVYATDLNGKGLNGSLDIVVKLLTKNQIAVITVQNAFLDDEDTVLNDLSEAIGYEIKVLRTVVISENNEGSSRKRRDVESNSGAYLQLYVYGLRESQPVDVLRLTRDIHNSNVATVNVARVLSLEDHLEGLEICPIPGRDTGLFVATIVLAVLLLIVIVVIFVWFILIKKFQIHLKWRKNENYEQFNDSNSVESRSSALESLPKVEIQPKPRLNIEELKRSERRLQEMLDIPVQEFEPVKPVNDVKEVTNELQGETILDIPNLISPLPIVIQSIDKLKTDNDESEDEDEFGEKKKEKPRKSVVTFNENVEKIIHLEDDYEERSESDLEVYKF